MLAGSVFYLHAISVVKRFSRIPVPVCFIFNQEFAYRLNNVTTGNNLLTHYAVSIGMGVRVGAMEYYNAYSHTPSWGSGALTLSGRRYQVVDYHHPHHSESSRIIGTENEGFGDETMLPGKNH